MRRLLVNDSISQLGEVTFWSLLKDWFSMEFVGGEFGEGLLDKIQASVAGPGPSTVIRNASYMGARLLYDTKQICLLQDIFENGPARKMQDEVIVSCDIAVANSAFTASHYKTESIRGPLRVIPLPVDFGTFEPQNPMGCQQALSLPDGCICWIGASQGPAGHIKGYDIFLKLVRMNPDLHFVGVFKDAIPDSFPPNLRCFQRLTHEELVKVIGACRVGLCTSRVESQHLAGIEMGACGLPLVVPNVGCYWNQGKDWASRIECPGIVLETQEYANAIRAALKEMWRSGFIREYWQERFDRAIIKKQWEELIKEVEGGERLHQD